MIGCDEVCVALEIRSLIRHLVEHSLQVTTLLFVSCGVHCFTSLSTLSRYEAGLKYGFDSLKKGFIAIRIGLIPLCCTDQSTKDETVLPAD